LDAFPASLWANISKYGGFQQNSYFVSTFDDLLIVDAKAAVPHPGNPCI
jgi:hypothetical protein